MPRKPGLAKQSDDIPTVSGTSGVTGVPREPGLAKQSDDNPTVSGTSGVAGVRESAVQAAHWPLSAANHVRSGWNPHRPGSIEAAEWEYAAAKPKLEHSKAHTLQATTTRSQSIAGHSVPETASSSAGPEAAAAMGRLLQRECTHNGGRSTSHISNVRQANAMRACGGGNPYRAGTIEAAEWELESSGG